MMHPEGGHIFLCRHATDPLEQGVCPFHANCFEGFASGPSLKTRWGADGSKLSERKNVWELEAFYIGQAICNYILLLSPECIILGGGVMQQTQLLPLIRKEVAAQLNGYIKSKGTADLEHYITGASLNGSQGILGALKLAIDTKKNRIISDAIFYHFMRNIPILLPVLPAFLPVLRKSDKEQVLFLYILLQTPLSLQLLYESTIYAESDLLSRILF